MKTLNKQHPFCAVKLTGLPLKSAAWLLFEVTFAVGAFLAR